MNKAIDSTIFKETRHFSFIDFLRGLAVLGVIAVHSVHQFQEVTPLTHYVFNYGQMGVQLFFLVSALTLCLSMQARKEASLHNFYVRRFFRIAPLYYFGIVFYFLWRTFKEFYLGGEVKIPEGYSFLSVVENFLFIHGFFPDNFNFVVPGGWSIATEMTFYLLFPSLYKIQEKLGFRKFFSLTLLLLSLCFGVEFAVLSMKDSPFQNDEFGFFHASILNQIGVFMIGILVFQKLKKNPRIPLWGFWFLGLNAASCFLLNTTTFKTGFNGFFYPLLSASAFAILTLKMSEVRSFNRKGFRLITEMGKLSFSMYLVHFWLLGVCGFVFKNGISKLGLFPEPQLLLFFFVTSGLTYALSKVAYRWIEKPGMAYGKRLLR